MHALEIQSVTRSNLTMLHDALTQLSTDLGDHHLADLAALESAGFGRHPTFFALIAVRDAQAVGALVWSPLFSTTRGGSGLFVSDLWVSVLMRGQGLGPKLLMRAVADAQSNAQACFIRLAVYQDNPDALRFYRRLGFDAQSDETVLTLQGADLARLMGQKRI